jgi:hypothetical protein
MRLPGIILGTAAGITLAWVVTTTIDTAYSDDKGWEKSWQLATEKEKREQHELKNIPYRASEDWRNGQPIEEGVKINQSQWLLLIYASTEPTCQAVKDELNDDELNDMVCCESPDNQKICFTKLVVDGIRKALQPASDIEPDLSTTCPDTDVINEKLDRMNEELQKTKEAIMSTYLNTLQIKMNQIKE